MNTLAVFPPISPASVSPAHKPQNFAQGAHFGDSLTREDRVEGITNNCAAYKLAKSPILLPADQVPPPVGNSPVVSKPRAFSRVMG